ncbi:glycosyltransferase [Arthrobacter sp. 92]|uniref:glycosyltransferase n=1 Tax=Arthrobacter sp. 92 TaxID=3418175 RepID=UPI003CFEDFDE
MSVTVLIPAHNEAAQLAATLYSLGRQTREASRVVVVADNCTDDTAAIGFACGAEVIRASGCAGIGEPWRACRGTALPA